MPDDKLVRVTGLASSNLLDAQNPVNPSNRRITILVMTREAEERLLGGSRTPVAGSVEATPGAAAPSGAAATR